MCKYSKKKQQIFLSYITVFHSIILWLEENFCKVVNCVEIINQIIDTINYISDKSLFTCSLLCNNNIENIAINIFQCCCWFGVLSWNYRRRWKKISQNLSIIYICNGLITQFMMGNIRTSKFWYSYKQRQWKHITV